ncbi:MAG: hypothetical protein HQ534_06620 [Armatimonadetes bacterium]|nr:hypothetical protein [Armatimonadota bacterium]
MIQRKISINESQNLFLIDYEKFGFKNMSALLRAALDLLMKEIKLNQLKKSAELYSEIYSEDNELKELTNSAIKGWPE